MDGDSSHGEGDATVSTNEAFSAESCDANAYPIGDACGTAPGVSVLGSQSATCGFDPFSITGPIVDDEYVYFKAFGSIFIGMTGGVSPPFDPLVGYLRRIPRCGGSTEEYPNSHITQYDAAAGYVSWIAEGKLFTLEEASGRTTNAYVSPTCIRDLEVDAAAAYYFDECLEAVVRMVHGADILEQLVTEIPAPEIVAVADASAVVGFAGLAVTADRIFVVQDRTVVVAPITGGTATPFYESPEPILGMAADTSAVYLDVAGPDTVHYRLDRVSITGAVTTLSDAALSAPVADDGFVYWSASGNAPVQNAVFRVSSAAPGTPEAVIHQTPTSFDVRNGRVYWYDSAQFMSAVSD